MPLLAVVAPPPLSVPAAKVPPFVPIARLTEVELSEVSTLPKVSSTMTVTAGLIVAFDSALVGCWPKTTLLALAGLTVSTWVPEVSPVAAP